MDHQIQFDDEGICNEGNMMAGDNTGNLLLGVGGWTNDPSQGELQLPSGRPETIVGAAANVQPLSDLHPNDSPSQGFNDLVQSRQENNPGENVGPIAPRPPVDITLETHTCDDFFSYIQFPDDEQDNLPGPERSPYDQNSTSNLTPCTSSVQHHDGDLYPKPPQGLPLHGIPPHGLTTHQLMQHEIPLHERQRQQPPQQGIDQHDFPYLRAYRQLQPRQQIYNGDKRRRSDRGATPDRQGGSREMQRHSPTRRDSKHSRLQVLCDQQHQPAVQQAVHADNIELIPRPIARSQQLGAIDEGSSHSSMPVLTKTTTLSGQPTSSDHSSGQDLPRIAHHADPNVSGWVEQATTALAQKQVADSAINFYGSTTNSYQKESALSQRSHGSHRRSNSEIFNGEGNCTCECGAGFSKDSELSHHEKRVHGPRNHICTEKGCSMAFGAPVHLRRHAAVHDENAPRYYCQIVGCDNSEHAYHRKDALKKHMDTKHTD